MLRILSLFRSKAPVQEKHAPKKTAKKGPSTVFRRKESVFRKPESSTQSKHQVKESDDGPLIQKGVTWTLSEDELDVSSTGNTDAMPIDLVGEARNCVRASEDQQKEENQMFSFTKKELMDNQLNHMRALSQLQTEVAELKYVTQELAKKHSAEMEKKDDEYVELLIKVRETEQELTKVKEELGGTKQELGVVVVTLMEFQHKLYQSTQKQDTGFWPSFSSL